MGNLDHHRAQIDVRRYEVARLYMQGHTYREIATSVGCSPATVQKDIDVIRKAWARENNAIITDILARQFMELNAIRALCWQKLGEDGYERNAVASILKALEHEARLVGVGKDDKQIEGKIEIVWHMIDGEQPHRGDGVLSIR